MLREEIFFTLPDDLSIMKKHKKNKLSLKIYFFLFSLFRFFIYKESLNLFISIFNIIIEKKNFFEYIIIKYKKYFYNIHLLFILKNRYFNKKYLFLDYIVYYQIILINVKYYNKYLYGLNIVPVFLFKEFVLRIPFILFIGFKSYIYKFKINKYNEYLLKISNLINYPLLKIILRVKVKETKLFNQNKFSFKIYFDKFINKFCKSNNKNLILFNFINKPTFFKFFLLYKKETFFFLFNYFKIYFLNIFFIYIYNIFIFQMDSNKIEINKWNIFYLFHLYWWLYKYTLDLPIWLYILIIIQTIRIYFNSLYNYLNLINLIKFIKKNNWIDKNLILIKINSIIFMIHFEKLYYKFFKLVKIKKNNLYKIKWKKYWNYIIKYYPLDFIYLPINYYNNFFFLNKFIKKYRYNLDKIHWKIFYTGNITPLYNIDLNILNYYFELDYITICKNIIVNNKNQENLLINFFFFYSFLRDLFYKIILQKNFIKYHNKKILIKFFLIKSILYHFNDNKYQIIKRFKETNEDLFKFFYGKRLSLIIYVIFIKKYTK